MRTRRSFGLMVMGVALLAVAHAANVFPDVQRQGLKAGVPTTALVIAWPWLPQKLCGEVDGGASSREMRSWQRGILRWQCERVIRNSNDRGLVGRAARSLTDVSPPYPSASQALLFRMFSEYCSDDPVTSDRAAEFLFRTLSRRFIPPRLDDSTAAPLVRHVQRGLGSEHALTVQRSATTAEYLGISGEPLLPQLVELVRTQREADLEPVGNAAMSAIGSLARESDAAWKSLLSLSELPAETVQIAALQEMTRAGMKPRATEIDARALALLESPSDQVAAAAVTTLIFAGAQPCAAAARILTRAQRSDAVAVRAIRFLASSCPSGELHSLLDRLLFADDLRTRGYAIDACAVLKAGGIQHQDALLRLVSEYSEHPELAEAAVRALAEIERAVERK